MKTHTTRAPIRWALALLPLLILTGCASQQAVTEQTDALGSRMARIEAALKDASDSAQLAKEMAAVAQHQARALESKLADQSARLDSLGAQLNALGTGQARLEERQLGQDQALTRTGQQLAEALAAAQKALDQAAAAGNASASLAAQLATLTGEAKAQQDKLAGVEGKLHEQARRLTEAEIQLGQVSAAAQSALRQAGSSHKRIEGKLVHTLTLTSDHYTFPLNSAELDSRDMAQLDDLAARLKNMGDDYYLEIQGHTDDSGYGEYNYLLGEARANAVSRYLHSKGGVPLHRMSVISYGAAVPIGGQEKGPAGKGNRRVVVLVLK